VIKRSLALVLLSACAAKQPLVEPAAPPAAPAQSAAPDPEAFRKDRPKPGAPGTFVYPTPTAIELPNGLRVLYVRRPGRVVSLSLVVRHGASSVPEGKSGLSGLVARMLTESTRKRSAMALAEAVESLGTTLGAAASRDDSRVSLTVLPADFAPALRLLGEVAMEPAFLPRDFERVKTEWLDGVRAEHQDPPRLAALAAVRALNGPVLGAPVSGTLAHVKRLGVADLKDFHARAYTPDNSALVVVGEVEEAAVRSEVASVFGKWRGKNGIPAQVAEPPPPPQKTRLFVIDRPGAVQTAISAVQPFPKRADPGHEAREIMVTTLGGLFTSRLNTNLREEHGFTYGARARAQEARFMGTLIVGTSVRTEVTAQSLIEINAELTALSGKEPPTAEELARSRADLEFSLGATLEHPSRVAGVISSIFSESLPLDYYARYATEVERVAPGQVLEAAQLLKPNAMIVVLVGDQKQFGAELAKAGFQAEPAPPELSE
jgi:zinc protease